MSDALAQRWARVVMDASSDDEGAAVVAVINQLTKAHKANRASVMTACAQILAQCITGASPDIVKEVRAGVFALIDGYATKHAVMEADNDT